MVHITQHAIDRYKQRIEDVSDDLVKQALTTPAIEAAAQMGCDCRVKRPDGTAVAIKGGSVVSVIPALNTKNRPSAAKMKRMARNAKRKRDGQSRAKA